MDHKIGAKVLQEELEGPEGWDSTLPEDLFWSGLDLWLGDYEAGEL